MARYYDPEKIGHELARAREFAKVIRDKAIQVYGGQCENCGSVDRLEFDHVNGDGAEHRNAESAGRMKRRIADTGRRLDDYELRLLCRPCHIHADRPVSAQALALLMTGNNWPTMLHLMVKNRV